MSRYIDADELLNRLPEDLPYKASVKRVLIQASEADVVEVVRCKDCKHNVSGVCRHDFALNYMRDDDYCCYGERRAEE